MKKTMQINLGGQLIHIDEDAYERIQQYIDKLKQHLRNTEGRDEILEDLEMRMAELLLGKLGSARKIVCLADVEQVVQVLGHPDEFGETEAAGGGSPNDAGRQETRQRRLFRDTEGKIFGGVCMGLSTYLRLDVAIIRILFVLLGLFTGFGIMLYIILWIAVPKVGSTADRLAMQGRPVTFDNIRQSVEEELRDAERRFNDPDIQSRLNRGVARLVGWIRVVLLGIARVIGVLLLVAVLVLAAWMATAWWTGGFMVNGGTFSDLGFGGTNVLEVAGWFLPADLPGSLVNWAVALLLGSVLVILLQMGIRLLLRVPPVLSRGLWLLTVVLLLVGTIISVRIGLRMEAEFRNEARIVHSVPLPADRSFYRLELNTLPIKPERMLHFDDEEDGGSLIAMGDQVYLDHLEVEILPSNDSLARLEWVATAHGPGKRLARTRAQGVEYEVGVDSAGTIRLFDLLSYPESDRFRDQAVQLFLYLPYGRAVHIDPSVAGYMAPLPRPAGSPEMETGGRTWYMSREGLVLHSVEP